MVDRRDLGCEDGWLGDVQVISKLTLDTKIMKGDNATWQDKEGTLSHVMQAYKQDSLQVGVLEKEGVFWTGQAILERRETFAA